MLSTVQLHTLKEALQTEKQRIETHLNQDTAQTFADQTDSEVSNHPADHATELTDQTMELAIDNEREEELHAIQEALRRIEKGTYGTCVICGNEIPFERLEALPSADTCIEHAQQLASEQQARPVEEDLLRMNADKLLKGVQGRAGGEDSLEESLEDGSSDSPSDQ